ncbi:HAD family hydrolase [Chloroflexota bacterium]
MKHLIQVILFDLGNTLIYSLDHWDKVLYSAIQEFYNELSLSDPSINKKISANDLHDCLYRYYDQRKIDLIEVNSFNILESCLRAKGITSFSETILRNALNFMYSKTQLNWRIENDAISILTELNRRGFSLGLVSNAADDYDVQQLIDQWKLRPYFDFILTSAACGYRKPHPLMFQKAISHFKIEPENMMMVGDTLTADILGANQMGIFSVWINRRSQNSNLVLEIKPDATIGNLKDLLHLLDK